MSGILPDFGGFTHPFTGSGAPPRRENEMETSVAEIHGYPRRPEGFEEPLFDTPETRRAVMDHYLGAPWLQRASDPAPAARVTAGEVARRSEVPVRLVRTRAGAGARLVYEGSLRQRPRRCSVRAGAVQRVLARWREVGGWWLEGGGTDRVVYRVELSSGAVVDLARERACRPAGEWRLVGVVD